MKHEMLNISALKHSQTFRFVNTKFPSNLVPKGLSFSKKESLVKPDRNAYICLRLHTTHRWRNIKRYIEDSSLSPYLHFRYPKAKSSEGR